MSRAAEAQAACGGYRLGFDVGGTFTDLVLLDSEGGVKGAAKVPTEPADIACGAVRGIRALLHRAGVAPGELASLIHATTQTSNALIERSGPRTALITTEGFRDILEFGREARYDLYDLTVRPVAPLVPRHLRFEVRERLNADGSVATPVDVEQVRQLAPVLAEKAVEVVAVCLLHGYRNGAHEVAIRDNLREAGFGGPIVLSNETCPEIREFERASTTVANAYLSPRVAGYIERLDGLMKDDGIAAPWHLISSHGGRLTVETAVRRPVELLECGGAASVLAAAGIARRLGLAKVLAFDMGGTTAKAAIVLDGKPILARSYEVARNARFKRGSGIPIQAAAIDLIEIGAGGGSIARIDRLGLVEVGPDSAGSDPGPACYGRGGRHPTVSDACLMLGYLNPGGLLGGEFPLDTAAAADAISTAVAVPQSVDPGAAAEAIFRVVVETMANAARIHILERGFDPREFAIIVCGGAGPMHAAALAAHLGVKDVLIMPHAGVGAAVGLLEAPAVARASRSRLEALDDVRWPEVSALIEGMRAELLGDLGTERADSVEFSLSCDMRYRGQGHEIDVPVPWPLPAERQQVALSESFSCAYRRLYGRTNPGGRPEVVSWRLEARGPRPGRAVHTGGPRHAGNCAGEARRANFSGRPMDVPVRQRSGLVPDRREAGPALVEEPETTSVVPPGAEFWADAFGNLRIRIGGAA